MACRIRPYAVMGHDARGDGRERGMASPTNHGLCARRHAGARTGPWYRYRVIEQLKR